MTVRTRLIVAFSAAVAAGESRLAHGAGGEFYHSRQAILMVAYLTA